MRALLSVVLFLFVANALAAGPLIRFGRGFAAEEQVWLMSARPDLTPNQGKRYELKQILFQANPERFQAFLAGELDAGTAPGLAVIFARAQGMDMKIVASICLEAKGDKYFTTTYMVKDDGPVKTIKDLKGGTIGVVGIKTATDLWARAGLINAGLVPDKDTKVVPMAFPVIGDAVRAFLADYVAVTKWYLANTEQAKADLHKANFVRTPLPAYLKTSDWKRDPNARVDVESLKKLSTFMLEKLQWLEKPVNVDSMVDLSYLPR